MAQRLFKVRYPWLYLGVSILWMVSAVMPWFDPSASAPTGWGLVGSIVFALLAVSIAVLAIISIVIGRRGGWPTKPPLAQESDPRLRH